MFSLLPPPTNRRGCQEKQPDSSFTSQTCLKRSLPGLDKGQNYYCTFSADGTKEGGGGAEGGGEETYLHFLKKLFAFRQACVNKWLELNEIS